MTAKKIRLDPRHQSRMRSGPWVLRRVLWSRSGVTSRLKMTDDKIIYLDSNPSEKGQKYHALNFAILGVSNSHHVTSVDPWLPLCIKVPGTKRKLLQPFRYPGTRRIIDSKHDAKASERMERWLDGNWIAKGCTRKKSGYNFVEWH